MKTGLRYTLEFIRKALPAGAKHILEIGCGDGELAFSLMRDGFLMIAIDGDPAVAAKAREKGVSARVLTWPNVIEETFDAVLFTRSLHHVHDLEGGVAAAVDRLRPGGSILVEDFRAEGNSARSDTWFARVVQALSLDGLLRDDADPAAIIERARAVGEEHHLHGSEAIYAALRKHGPVERNDAAYYFRYVEPDLRSSDVVDTVLREELRQIEKGVIDAPGQRFALTPGR